MSKRIVWNGITYPTIKAAAQTACAGTAIPWSVAVARVSRGWDFGRAVTEATKSRREPAVVGLPLKGGYEWRGHRYPSLRALARAVAQEAGISVLLAYHRLDHMQWSPEKAATTPATWDHPWQVATVWRGTTYRSVLSAAKAASKVTGVPSRIIAGRMNAGWDIERAAAEPPIKAEEGDIYLLTHRVTGQMYVGKTKVGGLAERIKHHGIAARRGEGRPGSLHAVIRKDGLDAFDAEVLEHRAPDAAAAERKHIARLRTNVSGLNLTAGGERGQRSNPVKYKGVWYETARELISRLAPEGLAVRHRFYKRVKQCGGWGAVCDEVIEQALATLAAPAKAVAPAARTQG